MTDLERDVPVGFADSECVSVHQEPVSIALRNGGWLALGSTQPVEPEPRTRVRWTIVKFYAMCAIGSAALGFVALSPNLSHLLARGLCVVVLALILWVVDQWITLRIAAEERAWNDRQVFRYVDLAIVKDAILGDVLLVRYQEDRGSAASRVCECAVRMSDIGTIAIETRSTVPPPPIPHLDVVDGDSGWSDLWALFRDGGSAPVVGEGGEPLPVDPPRHVRLAVLGDPTRGDSGFVGVFLSGLLFTAAGSKEERGVSTASELAAPADAALRIVLRSPEGERGIWFC